MKLSTLQLLSGLGLTSPFQILPASELLSESDTYSEYESESESGWEADYLEDTISLGPSSPHLPDLVMSTQLTGEKKTYSKATPRSALVSNKTTTQKNESNTPAAQEAEPEFEPDPLDLKENESTEDLSKAARPAVIAKKILLPRKQVLKPIPDESDEKEKQKNTKVKTVAENRKVDTDESEPESVKKTSAAPATKKTEPTLKKNDKKLKADNTTYTPKAVIETGPSLSGRSQRKRTRPKRFQEAFEELESLAKKYKYEKDEENDKSKRQDTDTEGEDEGIESEESEDSEQDERSELEKDLEAFKPLKKSHDESEEEKSTQGKFYCDRCRKYFRSKSDYSRHQATIMCICRCVECQMSFRNEEFLQAHMESEHQPLAVLKKSLKMEKGNEKHKSSADNTTPKSTVGKQAQKTPASKETSKSEQSSGKPRKLDPVNAPRRCCVVNCPKIPGSAKYLCTFPKELELAEKWEQKIEKANGEPLTPLDVYVCSKHFREELYMGSGLLKPGSVPSIFSNPKKKRPEK